MSFVGLALYWAAQLYFYAMLSRFVAYLVVSVNRSWKPKSILLPILDFCYTITDPPLRFVRRFVPPLRLGVIQLDLAWTIVLLVVLFIRGLATGL